MYGSSPETNGTAITMPITQITIVLATMIQTDTALSFPFISSKLTSRSMCRYLSSVEIPAIDKNPYPRSNAINLNVKPNQVGRKESCNSMERYLPLLLFKHDLTKCRKQKNKNSIRITKTNLASWRSWF